MRYLLTTAPPPAIASDYGLNVEHAVPVFVPGDEGNGNAAGVATATQLARACRAGASSVVLRNVMRNGDAWGGNIHEDSDARMWWEAWASSFIKMASTITDIVDRIECVAIDHARYPTRREREEIDWLYHTIAAPLEKALDVRVGMYGLGSTSPTVWKDAPTFACMYRDVEWDPRMIPWTIMPGQWRPNGGTVTVTEFIGVLDYLKDEGFDTVCVWSDPRKDAMGNPKTKPQDWHAFLTAAVLMSGRVVDVRKYEPPSWLPPIDEPSPAGVFGGGA